MAALFLVDKHMRESRIHGNAVASLEEGTKLLSRWLVCHIHFSGCRVLCGGAVICSIGLWLGVHGMTGKNGSWIWVKALDGFTSTS